MKTNDFNQRQHCALNEIQRLNSQLESGEIPESDGMERIEAIMQTVEADTAAYQRQQLLARSMPRMLWYLGICVVLILACMAMLYLQA